MSTPLILASLCLGVSSCDQTLLDNVTCKIRAGKNKNTLFKKTIKLSSELVSLEEKSDLEIQCIKHMNEELFQACRRGDLAGSFNKQSSLHYTLVQDGTEIKHSDNLKFLKQSCEDYLQQEPDSLLTQPRCQLEVVASNDQGDQVVHREDHSLLGPRTFSQAAVGEAKVECIVAMNHWAREHCRQSPMPESFIKRATLRYNQVQQDGTTIKGTQTHEKETSCEEWGLQPQPWPPVDPTPTPTPTPVPTGTPGPGPYDGNCEGFRIDSPTNNATAGVNGTWYSVRQVDIPINSSMVFCAAVTQPLVPNVHLSQVNFGLRNERSQNCGSAKITVQAPDPSLPAKDNGFYSSSGGATFTNAKGRDPKFYTDLAPLGTYRIIVEAVDRDNSGYDQCTQWEVSWQAVW